MSLGKYSALSFNLAVNWIDMISKLKMNVGAYLEVKERAAFLSLSQFAYFIPILRKGESWLPFTVTKYSFYKFLITEEGGRVVTSYPLDVDICLWLETTGYYGKIIKTISQRNYVLILDSSLTIIYCPKCNTLRVEGGAINSYTCKIGLNQHCLGKTEVYGHLPLTVCLGKLTSLLTVLVLHL